LPPGLANNLPLNIHQCAMNLNASNRLIAVKDRDHDFLRIAT
jgi:hypothetical protein